MSPEPIHLKIFSPNVVNLTLVDLPGMTKVGTSTELLLGHVATAQEHPTFTSVYPLGALESGLLRAIASMVFPVLAMHPGYDHSA